MVNLKVELAGKTYPLFIGIDILARLGEIYQLYGYKQRAILITNLSSTENSYLNIVIENFKQQNINIIPIFLTPHQIANGLRTVQQVALKLVKHKIQPGETIISLGGSQLGNISAFIAQIVYGGVPYFQIPTTLTAQVVQSVDPVCRLNSGSLVNLLSIKYERSLVWSDIALLRSLPERNFVNGLGYVIQCACLLNNGLFDFVENNLKEIFTVNLEVMEEIVFRSCQSRIDLSKQRFDEPKNQKRISFGEFMASVFMESTQNEVKFGEALLFGMLIEAILAFRSGVFNSSHFERFYEVLKQIPFYPFINQIDQKKLIKCLKDKISHHKPPALHSPQEFGKFTSYEDYQLSDFIFAFDLIISN
jgi:3-dehydroquinate synthase